MPDRAPAGSGLLRDPGRFARDILDPIRAVVGDRGIVTDRDEMAPLMVSWRDSWAGRVPLVVMPADTREMAEVVAICHRTRTPMVPQGGNTGVTGSQPHADDSEILISTTRMNRIRALDLDNDTITVDAGCVLGAIQAAAHEVGRLFPLSLGAEGSCQIGGNLSTNAGGVKAVRYGMARAHVMGLEVVLPDGQVWNGLRGLRKDNAGYDLKQVFIGAEGTLGIITGATLRLLPRPEAISTAFLATPSPAQAVAWLRRAKGMLGETIASCELMERYCIDIARKHNGRVQEPLGAARYPWYLLVELLDQGSSEALEERLLAAFEAGVEAGELLDGAIASSREQAANLWLIREAAPQGQAREGISYKHDVSVPISQIARFIEEANEALSRRFPGMRSFAFGHVGDGNIHFNPIQAEGEPAEVWAPRLGAVNEVVHDIVMSLGGSITAEAGVGRLRVREIARYKSPVEMEMMVRLKRCFDPLNLMNPGKVLAL